MMRRVLSVTMLAPLALHAQTSAFDRSKPPTMASAPKLVLPSVVTSRLRNGIPVQLVTQSEVPLVQVTLTIAGGTRLDGGESGVSSFTARMLTESAGSRDVNALQSELAFLGANLSSSASADAFVVSLNVPKRSLAAALDLMADVVQRPSFTAADVRRQRDLRAASIASRRDNPNGLAALTFSAVMFPVGHPYHAPTDGDSAATARLDSARVRAFYAAAYQPSRAKFVVVGDITLAEANALLTPRFGAWSAAAAAMAAPRVPATPAVNTGTRLFLVDKPGAAQSVIVIGAPGVARSNPDYAALVVMNTLLGESFSSRLNSNLRETKGYTYGIGSRFQWLPLPGPFRVQSAVRTDVTDSSLVEIYNEIRAIRDKPAEAVELARSKSYVALAVPGNFETNGEIAGQLVELNTFGLPLSSVSSFISSVNAVTAADVQRVARRYLPVDRFSVVVVGDLAKIRPGIEKLNLGAITVLDAAVVAR
jgi:zinc protease